MRILYMCSDFGIPVLGSKGASVHIRELISAFDRAGHSVILAAPVLEGSPWEEIAEAKARLIHIPRKDMPYNPTPPLERFNLEIGVENSLPKEVRKVLYNDHIAIFLKDKFKKHPPDFIYERISLYGIAGALLARELKIPRIVELNAPLSIESSTYQDSTGMGGLALQAEIWTLLQANLVITVSAPLADHIVSLGVQRKQVAVMTNGVDPTLFRPGHPESEVRGRLGLKNIPTLGFVGALRPWTGVDTLPTLIKRLIKKHPILQLVIVGDGPLRSKLERETKKLDLQNHIFFTGTVPHREVVSIIRLFDVALAPYSEEDHLWYASPMKLFEYMACGIPVVASNLGQIPTVVKDKKTGFLFPQSDLGAFTRACDKLLADPSLRQRMGEAGSQLVLNKYTWDRNASRVVEMASTLVERKGET